MNIESELLISILKLTKEGPVSHEVINTDVRFPASLSVDLLRKLQTDGLLYFHRGMVEVSSPQRLQLAVRALKLGASVDRVSSYLQWNEFESIAAIALENNDYIVIKNLHFKHGARKWEIDIVGCKSSLIICLDCKHWHHGLHGSVAARIVREQTERTQALAMSLPNPAVKAKCLCRNDAKFVPAILSLTIDKFKFFGGVPLVPVLQLQDFLNQLPAYTDSLVYLTRNRLQKTPFNVGEVKKRSTVNRISCK